MNDENKKSTYFPNAQKRYNQKCKVYSIKFLPKEFEIVDIIEKAIEKYEVSTNQFIKNAIKEKLQRDGFINEDD